MSRRLPLWILAGVALVLILLCAAVILLVLLFSPVRRSGESAAEQPATIVAATQAPAATEPAPTASNTAEPSPVATVEPEAKETTEPTATADASATAPPEPAEPVDDAFAAERAEIESNVASIRGLVPREPVQPTILTASQLRMRLEEELAEEYGQEQARHDTIVLNAFDFVEPDFDLYTFSLDLLSEQVLGFYEAETAEFVIVGDDEEFDLLEQLTHAHEYVHALQDQYYELELLAGDELTDDAEIALRALAEGDATLVQTLYLLSGHVDPQELLGILDELELDTAVLDSAPPILAHDLEFPYAAGLNFTQALFDQGGFAAVDAAWESLPQSTEQILHPERYLAGDLPKPVSLAPLTDTLGIEWQRLDEDVLGESYLREYLRQQLSDSQVDEAATGWGGDRYAVYWNETTGAVVMVLRLTWDTPEDGVEFAGAYPGYPAGLFGAPVQEVEGGRCWQGDDVICLFDLGGDALIVRAPSLDLARQIASLQPG